MTTPLDPRATRPPQRVASIDDAAQHRPRPLPLFLSMLRSETDGDAERRAAALAGLRTYQHAPRVMPGDRPRRPTIATAERARLIDFGGEGRPVLFVPSLVNGPGVLDISEDRSLLGWLAGQGVRPLLLDWGEPGPDERDRSIGDHVEAMLHPLLRGIGRDAIVVGYCLGGTMAIAAATIGRAHALALIAAPWRFAGYGDEARAALQALWNGARDTAERMGLLPVEVLQAAFWQLDPRRTVDKFAALGRKNGDAEAVRGFVAVEDWANGGPPLTLAAARDLFEMLVEADATGAGTWRIGEEAIDPARLSCPLLDIVSMSDRIVPAATAAGVGTTLRIAQGHVGMIVGNRARATLWEPLARWLRDVR